MKKVILMAEKKAYSFAQDIDSLRSNTDLLIKDHTPVATKRACDRMRAILDRIEENRQNSYVPYEVKQYFRDEVE